MEPLQVELLTKCEKSHRISDLFHSTIDKLLGRQSASFQEYSDVWNLEEWWQVNDVIQDVCKHCSQCNMTREQIESFMSALPEKCREKVVTAILVRMDELRQALLDCTTTTSGNYLKDLDWKLKLALSSDRFANLQEHLVLVDFAIETAQTEGHVSVELNKQELRRLISTLEAANKAVLQLRT